MNKLRFLALGLVIIASSSTQVLGQKFMINPEDGTTATMISSEYPDETVYAAESSLNVTFKYNPKEQQVAARVKKSESLIGLSDLKTSYYGYIHLNEQTQVSRISATDYRGKAKNISIGEEKYKSSGIFYDDITIKAFAFKFSKKGDRNSYSYNMEYKDVKYFTKSFFHTHYPQKLRTITYTIPSWLKVDLVEFNFDSFDISKEETTDKYNNTVITYTLNDIVPIKNEKFSSAYSVSLPHIIVVAQEYTQKGETHNMFKSTGDLYTWYSSLTDEMENDPSEFEQKVNSLTASANSDQEKIENIFYWVQDNVRYIAYEDGIMGFKPANAQDVYNKKYGDCKGMANLTCEMLKLAGYDARLTWIGTRSIPYTYNTPSLAVDNHMICTVFLDGKQYYLDATETGIAMGDYAHRIQGQDVLIEKGDEFLVDSVPNYPPSYNLQKTVLNLHLDGDAFVGSGTNISKGEKNTRLFRAFQSVAKNEQTDEMAEYLAKGNKNILITNPTFTGLNKREEPVEIKFDVRIKNQITSFDNEMYINTDFNENYSDWDVEDNRINDLSFSHKINEIKIQIIDLPAGYKIDFIPESILEENEEFKMAVGIEYQESKNLLVYTRELIIKNGNISSKYVEAWNTSIEKIKAFYSEQTILLKQ